MGEAAWGRGARLAVAFALLLAVATAAAPVFAEDPPVLPSQPQEELESPQAEAERETSEFAYADLSVPEEKELLREQFDAVLASIDADPARVLADLVLERVDSPTEALVTVDGEKVMLEAEVPLRVPVDDGSLHKVELDLEAVDGGYVPANPLVDLELPASSNGPIAIGDAGLAITAVGADDAAASPLGEGDLFLPRVDEDTSLLLSPIAGGLELSAMLASRNSPERLAFEVALPQGAVLREAVGGGAEVIDAAGSVLATITPPQALDAQGTEVPVTLRTEDNSLFLDLAHQEMDVAYPLFIDPEIKEDWSGFADTSKLAYWQWSWGGVGSEDFIGKTSCIVTCWGNGLYVRSRSGFSYPKGSWGRWWFTPQGSTTFMRRVVLGPMNYDAHGCNANEPHPYVGVWNDSSGWKVLNNAYPSGWATNIDTGEQNLGPGTRTAFVGIEAANAANINCGHDYRLGGATLFLSDPENPSVGTVSGYPTGWAKAGSTFTINAPVSDPGLGVYAATLSPGGSPPVEKKHGCDGHYANKCPGSFTFQFPIGAESFDEGEKPVRVSAKDAMEKSSNTYEWMMKVDRTPPEISLAGQLAEATDETEGDAKDDKDKPLPLPVYNLTIDTTDGRVGTVANPVQPAEKRSGVKKIEVFLDGGGTPVQSWEASSCAAGNCPLSKVFTLKLNELNADDDHYLRILARDFAGNAPRERKLEFEYIPATGLKDEYVMQYFPLADGSGDEDAEEHPNRPELAVNVVSGNLVYRQSDLELPGPGADLDLDLFYNSLLPESQNTEWGDGWTLAQTPELELEQPPAGAPTQATLVEEEGGVESKLDLPAAVGEEAFDKQLQATVTKEAGGGYELSDETGESDTAIAFDSSGRPEELRSAGAATVEFGYEGGDLAEVSVEDPATARVDPESIEDEAVRPDLAVLHSTNLGSLGSGDGQMEAPADVVADDQGNLWVLDRGNSRVEKYSPTGQFLAKFGSWGSGDGQLKDPSALALDAAGNIWIADTSNNRVQKFSPGGQFLAKWGSFGAANGTLAAPNGIAVDAAGTVWVSDVFKVQRFTQSGSFLEKVGGTSAATGQIVQPQSLATDAEGHVLVAETGADRVLLFDEEGDYVRALGGPGTGPGQFTNPTEVAAGPDGVVLVADNKANNIQLFNAAGDYITGFGAAGSGASQFAMDQWVGIAALDNGRVWVSDGGHNRVAEWLLGNYSPATEPVVTEDDPQLEVEVSEDLVEAVEGDEAGTISYDHSGDLLTAVDGPDGEADYAYDSAGRMTKVTLANGTYGEIAYEPTYGRVKSVTVATEGKNPKTTYFSYSDEPRRTTVTPPDAPATTYEIAADGSIFKWWNSKSPPIFDNIAGTLYDPNNRETSQPIAVGTHNLVIQAHDEEGIASIQIVANNNQLVDETTCEYDPAQPSKCLTQVNEWVTETGNWPPGIVYLEVIATDRLGEASSRRFWVNIPYTPPPDPEAEEPPRFSEILSFREEFGLDLDLKGNEIAINDRIFDLMGAWHNPSTPEGEVARATAQKWSVPLREVDAAELEFRERFLTADGPLISAWGASTHAANYAGFYIDHRSGGKLRVGFTGSQDSVVESLKQVSGLVAPDRTTPFPVQPQHPLSALNSLAEDLVQQLPQSPIGGIVRKVGLETPRNRVTVGSSDPGAALSYLNSTYGAGAPVDVVFAPAASPRLSERALDHRLFGGDWIASEGRRDEYCSLGFGAEERRFQKSTGQWLKYEFALTAGHCWGVGSEVARVGAVGNGRGELVFGTVRRRTYEKDYSGFNSDGEAILLENDFNPPKVVHLGEGKAQRVVGAEVSRPGVVLCTSGTTTGNDCGPAREPFISTEYGREWVVQTDAKTDYGDSGGSVWNPVTGRAVGLTVSGPEQTPSETWFSPLRQVERPSGPPIPGLLELLDATGGGKFNIVKVE
ncbi:MAG TPA: DUF6531 domain-containing protein [Solirubrobacterales bacterium]|nr:DUF6531 domain-containing protein [Solirubrobacterales bacterium]